MPTLFVHTLAGEIHRVALIAGHSVREALDATDLRVRAACGGTGACGACQVRLLRGEVNPPGLAEYQKLTQAEREAGQRLACQLRPRSDSEILLDHPAPPSQWKSIPPENLAPIPGRLPHLTENIYGVAVDLGTTHIRVALWDRKHGVRIATRRGANPQGIFGADVLNRLKAAQASPQRAAEMTRLVHTAILQAIRDILARDIGEVTPMLAHIGQVIIVGNTAMLALLTGRGGEALIDPTQWQLPVDCRPDHLAAWRTEWSMPHADIVVPDPVAGFIGSDLVADLIATDFLQGPPGSLLLDVGTNIEIALWDGKTLRLTATPGGPAFEGVGIRHGMAAEPGAICHVLPKPHDNTFHLETLGGDTAKGFCGSGLIDAVAVLRAMGLLKRSGRFATAPSPEGLALDPQNPHTAITGRDIDAFQRAKAAMAAAMAELLRLANLGWSDLQRLCICGAFGRHLDITHAQAVGLLPEIAASAIELHADASLVGCEHALLTGQGASPPFTALTENAQVVNLSFIPGYEDRYIDHLPLRPVPPVA